MEKPKKISKLLDFVEDVLVLEKTPELCVWIPDAWTGKNQRNVTKINYVNSGAADKLCSVSKILGIYRLFYEL